ncbi:hypothetical protein VTN77DRAFT_5698 [Rasamsonia byssochlamydoides]|uniref:uncharacterized protein n=1 Tax=Rasamsonia byssochlamydoides TaxID=89139 RepID=UPI0037431CCE
MASAHSFLQVLFCTLVFSFLSFVSASPWIVTSYYQLDLYTEEGYTDIDTTIPAETRTEIVEITPTATSLPAPLSTSTVVIGDEYASVTVVQVLLPSVPAATSTVNDPYDELPTTTADVVTSYYVNLVYTAPTSCSSAWTTTTAVEVYVPYAIEAAITPTSVSTSYSTDDSQPFQPITITQVMAFINPSQVPASSLSVLSAENAPYTMYDGSSGCSYYNSNSSYYSGDSGSYDDDSNWLYDSYGSGIAPLAIILIIVLGWFVLFFIIGLIESYFQFQRLMKGWQARRGLPISWCLLAPIVSCILLAFSRKGFQARTEDEAEELERKWKEMGFWKKIGLWLQYGFRWKYPPMLGPAPARVGRPSKRPIPVTPLLQVSPPRSAGSQSQQQPTQPSSGGDPASSSAQREMSQVQPPLQTLQVPSSSRLTRQQVSSSPRPATQQDDEITVIPPDHSSS